MDEPFPLHVRQALSLAQFKSILESYQFHLAFGSAGHVENGSWYTAFKCAIEKKWYHKVVKSPLYLTIKDLSC